MFVSFNPRTHTGCDICYGDTVPDGCKFQSTHPHGVRHVVIIPFAPSKIVSIHAPTRGATINTLFIVEKRKFQSTHPHGVRQCVILLFRGQTAVSIHAPTRGATQRRPIRIPPRHCFNPRTHTGCDPSKAPYNTSAWRCFNPRTHTGCDQGKIEKGNPAEVSIHAPTRGATEESF